MGTVEGEPTERIHGVISAGNKTIEVVSDVAYGHNRGSLYPMLLLLFAGIAILTEPLVALIPLILLAIWVGGRGR